MPQTKNSSPARAAETAKRPHIWRWIALIALLVALGSAALFADAIFLPEWRQAYSRIQQSIQEMGWMGGLAVIGLMIVHCFVPFPAEFVAIAAGSAYGTIVGTILTWSGAMIGAMLSFGLTRAFGQPFVEWILPDKQKSYLDEWTADQGATTLLVSRFIPVIAFNLINYAAGLTKVSWWTFIWTTGVGIFPLTATMVYMGSEMRNLSWTGLFAVSGVCILAMALLHWIRRRQSHS